MSVEAAGSNLTFLFADLESSTRLWERHPAAMTDAMQRHDEIMRRAVEGAAGRVVKTTGDGLMAVFGSARDALGGCLAAQRGLQAEEWGETGPLRARMGLHSGEAQGRDADYFGPAVYRAARVMSAAHGGQVLVSGATATLARRDGLPDGAELRDLGEHRLKDLLQPERLYQLLHADLPSEFPPLTTLGRRPNNLPTQTSELIGRRKELEAVRDHLDSPGVRLLTLTGPGGIGKTRLALQAAADQIDRFEHGVFFVDLSSARDRSAVLESIVRAVGITMPAQAELDEVLGQQLADQELLLLLDNFEQVMEAAASVADLLRQCPRLKVLVTSRETLRVRGEQLFPVAPLSLPADLSRATAAEIADCEAVRLFVERAQEARPDFVLTDANAATVAEICARLDGLPLAIELAAARLRLFSPDDLADRLRGRLQLLRGGARDLPERQQTLRRTIEWSYELLDAEERAVFELVSVFSGAPVESIEEVAAAVDQLHDVDIVERLGSLVDKSLVRSVETAAGQRLSMLETIRDFALEMLESDPQLAASARRAHAEHFTDFAVALRAEAGGPQGKPALDALSSELGNLQAAWRHWAGAGDMSQLNSLLDALWWLHDRRGWYHGAVQLVDDLLGVLAGAPADAERAEEEITLRLSLARGLLAIRGYTEEVEAMYLAALDVSESLGTLPRRFPVLRSLASYYLYRADWPRTESIAREILELGEQQNDAYLQAEAHLLLGPAVGSTAGIGEGLDHLARCIELFDPQRHASARFRLGPITGVPAHTTSALFNWMSGKTETADRHGLAAIELARQLDHPYSLAYATFHVGLLDVWSRRPEPAHQRAAAVLDVAAEHNYQIWTALGQVLEGISLALLGEADRGLARLDEGLALYENLTTPPVFWPLVLGLRAAALTLAGQPRQALEILEGALDRPDYQRDGTFAGLAIARAELLAALGDEEAARSWLQGALADARGFGASMLQLQAATRLARLERGPVRESVVAELRALLETFSEGLDSPDVLDARAVLDEIGGGG